jgi:uncharacterized membrane protein
MIPMQVLLPIHIVAGGLAIVLGAVALYAAKGATLHRQSGKVFVAAMITMGTSGAVLALKSGPNANAIGGFMAVYLVITSLTTVRRPAVGARPLEIGAMLLAFALGLLDLVLGFAALAGPRGAINGVPAPVFFMFAVVGLLAGAGDLRVIRSGPRRGVPRLARHLWRMCLALWIATASFFSVRARVAKIFPEAFLSPGMRVLPVALVLLAMVYWLGRVRVGRTYRRIAGMSAHETA